MEGHWFALAIEFEFIHIIHQFCLELPKQFPILNAPFFFHGKNAINSWTLSQAMARRPMGRWADGSGLVDEGYLIWVLFSRWFVIFPIGNTPELGNRWSEYIFYFWGTPNQQIQVMEKWMEQRKKKHGDSRIFKWDKMGQSFMEKRETKTWCCFSIWIRWEFMVMFWYKYSGLTMGQPLKNMDTECVI